MSTERSVRVHLTAVTSQFKAAMAQASAQMGAFANNAAASGKKNREAFTLMGAAAVAGGALIVAGLAKAAKAAIEFESSFAGVRKTVDATEKEFKELESGLRGLALKTPIDVNELNRIAEAAGALGVAKGDILPFTKVIAELAATTDLTAEAAANSMARLRNAFDLGSRDIDMLGNVLVDLGNKGASTESEILGIAELLSGTARVADMSAVALLGVSAGIANVGENAEAGSTAMSRFLLTMVNAAADGGKELDVLAKVSGQSVESFAETIRTAPEQAIVGFVAGLERMRSEGTSVTAVFKDLDLADQRVIRTFLRLSANSKNLAQSLRDAGQAATENNARTKEFAERVKTFESKLGIMRNAIKNAAIDVGGFVLNVTAPFVDMIASISRGFAALPEGVKKSITALAALAGGFGLIGGAALLAAPRIGDLIVGLKWLHATRIGGGIAGTISGLLHLKTTLLDIATSTGGIKGAFSGLAAFLSQDLSKIGTSFGSAFGAVGAVAASAGVGFAIGTAISKNIIEPLAESKEQTIRTGQAFDILEAGLRSFATSGRASAEAITPLSKAMAKAQSDGLITADVMQNLNRAWTDMLLVLRRGGDPKAIDAIFQGIIDGSLTGEEAAKQLRGMLMEVGTEAERAATKAIDLAAAWETPKEALEGYQKVVKDLVKSNQELEKSVIGFDLIEPVGASSDALGELNEQLAEARQRLNELRNDRSGGKDIADSTITKAERRVRDLEGKIGKASVGALAKFREATQANTALMSQYFADLQTLSERGHGLVAAEFARLGPSAAGAARVAVLGGVKVIGTLGTDIAKALLLAKRQKIDPTLDLYAPNFAEKFAASGQAAREALVDSLDTLSGDLAKGIPAEEVALRFQLITAAIEEIKRSGQVNIPAAAAQLISLAEAATDPQTKIDLLLQALGEVGTTNATATVDVTGDDEATDETGDLLSNLEAIEDTWRATVDADLSPIERKLAFIRAELQQPITFPGDTTGGGQITGAESSSPPSSAPRRERSADQGHPEARAAGGPVYGGRRYLVGERGPEILELAAGVNGRIHPNAMAGPASIASGRSPTGSAAGAGSTAPQITNHITVNARTDDPRELAAVISRELSSRQKARS